MSRSSATVLAFADIDVPEPEVLPSVASAFADIEAILMSFKLQEVRRFFNQVHWSEESERAALADEVEPGFKLENVAAHSWHVADTAILLSPHFPQLDYSKVLTLAVLHDKLEIFTGDYDPVGADGTGRKAHVFNAKLRRVKAEAELHALHLYLEHLREEIRPEQERLFLEIIEGRTKEALFIKAVDKLQALAFVYLKKGGRLSDEHLAFTVRYSRKVAEYFPELRNHYIVLLGKLMDEVVRFRGIALSDLALNVGRIIETQG